jgi:SM-20-related protein
VIEATLALKDGQSRAVRMPAGRDFQLLLHYMRVPADAAGKMFRFQAPAGEVSEIPAGDIASLEVPPPHALIPDFLTGDELATVLAFAMSHAQTFRNSGVHEVPNEGASPTGYRIRRSRVLEGAANGPMAALMMPKLQALMPKVWPLLRLNPLPLGLLECEVTAHGDGDFFAVHTDNGMPEIAHRLISYVLYFHRDDPKQFSGGHLNLYHTLFEGGVQKCGRRAAAIEPPRNGLMVFPTFIYHEVSPIRCASTALTDQRLTLNGWLF